MEKVHKNCFELWEIENVDPISDSDYEAVNGGIALPTVAAMTAVCPLFTVFAAGFGIGYTIGRRIWE